MFVYHFKLFDLASPLSHSYKDLFHPRAIQCHLTPLASCPGASDTATERDACGNSLSTYANITHKAVDLRVSNRGNEAFWVDAFPFLSLAGSSEAFPEVPMGQHDQPPVAVTNSITHACVVSHVPLLLAPAVFPINFRFSPKQGLKQSPGKHHR